MSADTEVQDYPSVVHAEVAELPEAVEPITPDPPRTEAERLDPTPTGPVVLASGTQVEVVPMKLRETMKLLRIITHGAGGYLGNVLDGLNLDKPDEFAQTLVMVTLMSLPDAEQESIDFIRAMCQPVGYDDLEAKARVEAKALLDAELHNPELEDVVTILERVIRRESEDIRALGKRLSQALNLAQRVGEAPVAPSAATPKG